MIQFHINELTIFFNYPTHILVQPNYDYIKYPLKYMLILWQIVWSKLYFLHPMICCQNQYSQM